jgi:hypothetical protein
MKKKPEKKRAHNRAEVFLAAYRVTCSIGKAAAAAGIERGMHYRRLKSDPAYKAAFEEAHEIAIQALEDEAVRRAHEGVKKPLVYQGQFTYAEYDEETRKPIGEPLAIREYSDSLLMFLLRGARPEKYRERHTVSGENGGPIEATLTVKFV